MIPMKMKFPDISILCTAILLAFTTLLLLPLPVFAKDSQVTMTECSATSFTIAWEKPTIEGEIQKYRIYDAGEDAYLDYDLNSDCVGVTFSDLSKGYVGRLRVDYEYMDALDILSEDSLGYVYVNTTPVKMSVNHFGIDSISDTKNALSFCVAKPNRMTGTQIALYKGSKKITTLKFKGAYSEFAEFKNDTVYKYRARTYYKNPSNGETYYGAWSSYRYFDSPTVTGTYQQDTPGCRLKLKKVTGVESYSILVSTKESTGYRETATVTVDSGKTQTIDVAKIGKKKMKKKVTYYIRIIPNIKVGDGTAASDIFTTLYFVNPK